MIINISEPIKFSIGNETGDEKYYFERFGEYNIEYICTRNKIFYEFVIQPKVIYNATQELCKLLTHLPGITINYEIGGVVIKQDFKDKQEENMKIEDEVWNRVEYYLNQYKMHMDQFEKISNTVGFGDGPLCDSVYQLAEALIDACSDLIKDKHSWIPWFVYDNEFGKRKFGANFASGKEIRVETLDDLRRVIEEE